MEDPAPNDKIGAHSWCDHMSFLVHLDGKFGQHDTSNTQFVWTEMTAHWMADDENKDTVAVRHQRRTVETDIMTV